MHYSKNMIVKISLTLFLIILLFVGCNEDSTALIPPVDDSAIEINFPIGKTAVYAVGTYFENEDSLSGQYLSIYSLQFDEMGIKNNVAEYSGKIEEHSRLFNNPDSIFIGGSGTDIGTINVTIDNKWVLFQHSSVMGSYQIFMKRISTTTDSTLIPTFYANQLPMFPKILTSNTTYSVYRPGTDSLFGPVQRDFEVHQEKTWTDIYGSSKGLYCETDHLVFSFLLNFNAIFDSHGIVTSRLTVEDSIIRTVEYPDGVDTVTYHLINRRIVDFTEPENVKELSWYADYVSENGLALLEEN